MAGLGRNNGVPDTHNPGQCADFGLIVGLAETISLGFKVLIGGSGDGVFVRLVRCGSLLLCGFISCLSIVHIRIMAFRRPVGIVGIVGIATGVRRLQ